MKQIEVLVVSINEQSCEGPILQSIKHSLLRLAAVPDPTEITTDDHIVILAQVFLLWEGSGGKPAECHKNRYCSSLLFPLLQALLQHYIRVPKMNVDGLRILYRNLLDELPDKFLVELGVALRTLLEAFPHLPVSGSLFLRADLHLSNFRYPRFQGLLLLRQGQHPGVQLGITHVRQQSGKDVVLLLADLLHTLFQGQQLRSRLG